LSERIVVLPQLQVRGLTNTPSEEFNKHVAIDDPTYCTLRTMMNQLKKIFDVCKTRRGLGFKYVFVKFDVSFFSKTVQTVAGAHPASYSMGSVFFPGNKVAGP
jgi:hypothetical protein